MTILSVSVTEAGRALAGRLSYEHAHGPMGDVVRHRWAGVDGFVLFVAAGAAVRMIAPMLRDKLSDPAIVCVDEAGRFAVALCGGHSGGANALARSVAAVLGATPVVTTATDAVDLPSLDQLPGFVATGDVAGVTKAILDGRPPRVDNHTPWPLPALLPPSGPGPARIIVTDLALPREPGVVALHPPSLVAGIGASTGAPPDAAEPLLTTTLARAGLARESVGEVATIDRRATDDAVVSLGLPVRAFSAGTLASVEVPTPSEVVRAAVGTASVAEAAALLAGGPGAELIVTKQVAPQATVAIARRRVPRGHLAVVGLGPGDVAHRTPAAERAVRRAEVVIGYGPYVDACADLLTASQEVVRSPIGDETVRAKQAVSEAGAGRRVALVCSGDAGVYAMASLTMEVAGDAGVDVEVVPGVTAALAAAALLGAPLGHDHVVISLSDLLTPWSAIELRLRAAAAADLVVALYNPRSRGRTWQFDSARSILLEHRSPTTPVGVVTDASRAGQSVALTTLGDVDPSDVGMTTCVIVGSSATRVIGGRMVTPRGYRG
ncbi:MAG TPA: precorrin-3B C(17)-methyltransferase [Acidimicrobiales bacterium]|nr:precorrin-3B C(17)-methyltransferase [Acidimicrobiales bacterium]